MATATATAPTTERAGGGVAAIVVNYRTPALALASVRALLAERARLPDLRVLLVDGGSGDDSAERMREGVRAWPGEPVELLALPDNGGFGHANNQALLRLAEQPMPPRYVCLVNPDAEVEPGALAKLAGLLDRHPRAAAAGGQLQDATGAAQGSAFPFPSVRGEFCRGAQTDALRRLLRQPPAVMASDAPSAAPWVTGAAVMLRWAALAEVGLFDSGFFLYFEEVELMHRLRAAGWEIWHDPGARVAHLGGGSTDIQWNADGFHKRQPLPRWWYGSRRRYFVRTGGPVRAVLATLAFLMGRLVWLARVAVQRRRDAMPLRTARDTLRFSLWPTAADRRAHVARFGDAPGGAPGWMVAPR